MLDVAAWYDVLGKCQLHRKCCVEQEVSWNHAATETVDYMRLSEVLSHNHIKFACASFLVSFSS